MMAAYRRARPGHPSPVVVYFELALTLTTLPHDDSKWRQQIQYVV